MSTSKIQPNSREAEESLIGCLLIGSSYIEEAASSLRPEMFFHSDLRTIMKAILSLYERSVPIDIVTVTAELKTAGEAQGYALQVMELSSMISHDANVASYAQLIIQKYTSREAARMAAELYKVAMDDDINEVLTQSAEISDALLNNLPTTNAMGINEIFALNAKGISDRAAGDRGTYIDFGIRAIDRILGGAEQGALVVVGGRPGAGKTSFAMQLAYNVSSIHPVLYFTLEMTREELGLRYLVMLTDIDSNRLKRAEGITVSEWRLIEEAGAKLEQHKIIIDDSSRLSIYNLRSKIFRMVRSSGVKMVFIDYLQLMDGAKGKEGAEYYGSISRACKQLAKELKIVIVLLSQLNREIEKRSEKIPRLSDLRSSGEIEQDANIVMFPISCKWAEIDDPSKGLTPGKAIISIAKNRNGQTGTAIINVSDNFMQWWDESDIFLGPRMPAAPSFQKD
jgi:replicative DNA helicase